MAMTDTDYREMITGYALSVLWHSYPDDLSDGDTDVDGTLVDYVFTMLDEHNPSLILDAITTLTSSEDIGTRCGDFLSAVGADTVAGLVAEGYSDTGEPAAFGDESLASEYSRELFDTAFPGRDAGDLGWALIGHDLALYLVNVPADENEPMACHPVIADYARRHPLDKHYVGLLPEGRAVSAATGISYEERAR